jgi:hypothetical protein
MRKMHGAARLSAAVCAALPNAVLSLHVARFHLLLLLLLLLMCAG